MVSSNRPNGRNALPAPIEQVKRGPGRPKVPVSREALVQHARAAFGEVGYARASMDLIARRAGLRKSSLFHHFATKDDLYLEVFHSILGELSRFVDVARDATGPFAERLDALSLAVTSYLAEHPDVAAIVLRELIDPGPFAKGYGEEIVRAVLDSVAAFLDDGQREAHPARAPVDARHLALSIAGMHLAYFAASGASALVLRRSPFDDDEIAARSEAVRVHVRRLAGVA